MMDIKFKICLIFAVFDNVFSCFYPAFIQNITWQDNSKGRVVYKDRTMTGWSFTAFTQTISDWECFLRNENFVVSRSLTPINVFGTTVNAYICQKLLELDDNTVYYYLMGDKEENAQNERVHVTADIIVNVCDVCFPKSAPRDSDYRVLSRNGLDAYPEMSETVSVGCNPCSHKCHLSGTPAISTTTDSDFNPVARITKQRPPIRPKKKKEGEKEEKSNVGVIVGVILGSLAVMSIVIGSVIWYFRFKK